MRTPLNGCLASAEMLLDTPLAEEQRELANTIRVSGSILLSTVSNFLDFFKLEASKRLDIVRSEVLLSDLAGDVHCIIEAMTGRGGAVALLPPDLAAAPAAPVLCDADRVRGVLLNLATNAAKFTRRGHIVLRVREVPADFHPAAPAGFAGITIRPAGDAGGGAAAGGDADSGGAGNAAAGAGGAARGSGEEEGLGAMWLQARQRRGAMVRECSFDAGPASDQQPEWRCAAAAAASAVGADAAAGSSGSSGASSSRSSGDATAGAERGGGAVGISTAAAAVDEAAPIPPPRLAPRAPYRGGRPGGRRRYSGGETVPSRVAWLLFEVEDTGCGVGADGLHRLFTAFVQGSDDDMRRPRSKGGTGLGLAICSKQVAVMGGSIGAFSRPGAGSTFWFLVPARVLGGAAGAAAAAERQQREAARLQRERERAALFAGLPPPPGGGGVSGGAMPGVPEADNEACPGDGGSASGGSHTSIAAAIAAAAAANAASTAAAAPPPPPLGRASSAGAAVVAAAAGAAAAAAVGAGAAAADPAARLRGLRVLLAEDNAINQLVAKKMLAALGMDVTVAANGADAVAAVDAATAAAAQQEGRDGSGDDAGGGGSGGSGGGFAVVLMDLLMPVMGGLEATRAIRAKGHPLPIVAMTANAGDADRGECLAAGMDGFLPKPVLRDQLAAAILDALEAARARGGARG